MNGTLTAIGTVGFPVVMCLLMAQYVMRINDSHKEESKYFTEAINRNTEALTKLQSLIEYSMGKDSDK